MITLAELDRALVKVRGFHKKSMFCPKRSLAAYRLSKMSRNYRGKTIEIAVYEKFRKKGNRVVYLGGNCSFDMLVNGKRVEVKSALAKVKIINGVEKYTYDFKHICPNNFHKLILVFVSPSGISIRTMDSRTVAKYTGSKYDHKSLRVSKKILGKVFVA